MLYVAIAPSIAIATLALEGTGRSVPSSFSLVSMQHGGLEFQFEHTPAVPALQSAGDIEMKTGETSGVSRANSRVAMVSFR